MQRSAEASGGEIVNKLIAKALYGVVVIEAIAVLIAGFLAYFVQSYQSWDNTVYDGLGRLLKPAPFIARFVFGTDEMWPGWTWFLVDFVMFWGAVAIGYGLISLASKLDEQQS